MDRKNQAQQRKGMFYYNKYMKGFMMFRRNINMTLQTVRA